MMTPKQALIKDGTIPVKEGRGRLSREAIERCKYLVSQGWDIKGYALSTPAPTQTSTPSPVVKKAPANNVKEVREFTIFYPEESFRAVGVDKKRWGMREVCNTCRVSLVQCQCGRPTILDGIKVSIVPK